MHDIPGRLVLLGDPVEHSISPLFQNAALKAAGIPLVYESLRVGARDIERVLTDLIASNAAGNVTVPHKLAVHDACDEVTPVAKRAGAVNTFWVARGKLHGDNTDVGGFSTAVRALSGDIPAGSTIALIGAGGAAAAVLTAAEGWADVKVAVLNRDADRARNLVRRFPDVARVETNSLQVLREASLVVNATPIGQRDDNLPCDVHLIGSEAMILDLVYRRGGTPWVKAARARGLRADDGLRMLLEQGALSFERWFGIQPNREVMERSVS